jgi:hypothetical protein
MSKTLRLSEKWFHRGLWLVAFLFAWFLTGLGSTIVGDLPQVEQTRTLEDFMDPQRTPVLKASIKTAERSAEEAQAALDQAQLKLQTARADNRAARETFDNWLATRRPRQWATKLIARTKQLDELRQAGRATRWRGATAAGHGRAPGRNAQASCKACRTAPATLSARARGVRVFGYRLAHATPAVAAGQLFAARPHRGLLCGASSSLRCSPSSWSWCPTCPATAATCATSWS